MTTENNTQSPVRMHAALQAPTSSTRLQAALAAGTHPDPRHIEILLQRCAVEPNFFVRDMLTWALARHSSSETVPLLLAEMKSTTSQARSQALHTLSKIDDPAGWAAITEDVLRDPDDEVARSAWRAAVCLVPVDQETELARTLCSQLGRGDVEVQRSLSRAVAALGGIAAPFLRERMSQQNERIRIHAIATERLLHDPEEDFGAAIAEAKRLAALTNAPCPEPEGADR